MDGIVLKLDFSLILSDECDHETRTGVVCIRVWNGWDESMHLQVWGHGSLLENSVLLPLS